MPKLVVPVNPEAVSAFAPYDGPQPPVGNGYEGVIKHVRVKESGTGNLYLNVLVEHQTKDPAKKQYNGAGQWIRVMFGEHNETQARLTAFIKAVTGKANKEANIVDTDVEARKGTGSLVKTIDGVKPEGKAVKFDLQHEAAQNGYEARVTADNIRRSLTEAAAAAVAGKAEDLPDEDDEVDEDDLEVESDEAAEEEGDEVSREEREAELKKEPLADLRAAAKEAGIVLAGMKKADIIQAILDWEFEDVADEEGEEDADEEAEELELEEGDDSEEEEEDDEEDEAEGDDPEAEIRAELAGLDRTALKARLKEANEEAKVLKKDTDDDLRDKIVDAELGEPPF